MQPNAKRNHQSRINHWKLAQTPDPRAKFLLKERSGLVYKHSGNTFVHLGARYQKRLRRKAVAQPSIR